MQNTAILSVRSGAALWGRDLGQAFRASLRRHRWLHALALAVLAMAVIVGAKTGNMPDFGAVEEYGSWLFLAFAVFAYALAIGRFLWLAFVERNPSPLGAFFAAFTRFFGSTERIANALNGLFAIIVFVSAFGVLKGAIAILSPFYLDRTLSHLDHILAFGAAPYERLWWLATSPAAVMVLNFAYNFWFLILIGTCFSVAISARDTALRHQFIAAFMLIWTVGGFFMAVGFSSAGPCYFALIGLGDAYQPLVDSLKAISADHSVWALYTQDTLWQGYIGTRAGSAGISAFPSMHVAMATLYALYWSSRSKAAGIAFWLFAFVIYVGSIVLGWHYAVDGIGGSILALFLWKLAGAVFGRFAEETPAA
ncbi:MAG TPA: phosphatase PAP2 family protein [Rhizobiaceae bacterium]|nr:phosphatase PAP2 family protein [Rhizobiaceae bacterium]